MLRSISNIRISHRLFLAFLLVGIISVGGIAMLGILAINFTYASAPQAQRPLLIATILAAFITIVIIILIGTLVSLTITHPLKQLATLTTRIAQGETNARATMRGRDEICLIATSMNDMLDNIVHLIQVTQSQHDDLQAQVEKLVSEVSGVGEGDLRVQAEVSTDALGVLADSFNYMVEELASLVVRVKLVAHEVERSTSSILDRMTLLVATGDSQIHQIAEAVVEVEHVTATSRQVAERAQMLYNAAYVTRHDAHGGREAVKQTIEAMRRIHENVQGTASKVQTLGERSRTINEIVEVIASIAYQTNRLALDAAIQAAMAGENGKAFGAVAADIRRLAELSKNQVGIIARNIHSVREDITAVAASMYDTQRETAVGAQLAREVGDALGSIFSAVENQAHAIEHISRIGQQQLQSSSAVVQIMHGVSESTQQSSLNTREASQNMERLARLVEQLRASVEAFKLLEKPVQAIPDATAGDDPDTPLTISRMMRTVSSTARRVRTSGLRVSNSIGSHPPIEDPFSFYPPT